MPKGNKKKDIYAQPLTRKDLRKEIKAAARAQYGPVKRQLAAEQRASKQAKKEVRGDFANYIADIDPIAAATASAYGQAGESINQTAQTNADFAERLRQQLAKEGAADAQLRGATYTQDPSLAQSNLARLNTAATLSGVNAIQGANAQNYLGDKKRIGKREMVEQLSRERDVGRSINQEQRATARDIGAFKTTQRADLIDRERDYLLGVQAAQLNRRGQKIDARQAAIDQRLKAQSQAETARHNVASEQNTARGHQITARENRYERHHPNAGEEGDHPGKNAQQQQRANRRLMDELEARLQTVPGKTPEEQYQWILQNYDKVYDRLIHEAGNPTKQQVEKAIKAALKRLR